MSTWGLTQWLLFWKNYLKPKYSIIIGKYQMGDTINGGLKKRVKKYSQIKKTEKSSRIFVYYQDTQC